MASQQHKIMRQVLEVDGCAAGDAPRLQSELRALYYRRLLPAIDRACSGSSTPGRIDRIDTLEIDLGEVPLEQLESALIERFDVVFARALAAAIASRDSAEVDSDLELFSYFIRTGTVPWWADPSDRGLLEASLEAVIRRAPRALRQAIESAPAQDTVWRRIALAFPDRLLDELVAVLASPPGRAYPRLGTAWLALLELVASAQGYPKSGVRTLWWEELLRAANAGQALLSEAPRSFGAILFRLARRMGIDHRSLLAGLHRTLDHPDVSIRPWVREIVESLHPEGSGGASARESQAAVREREAREPVPEREARVREPPARVDLRFSDADEIYVANAGLVILWPFLERFFAELDLIEAKQFKDAAAQQRAVGVLQYLAAEDAAAPEHLVPLNKVLCGMPPDEVFDFGPPITAGEIDACTDLLTAAIHHAPILRDMSIPGFRASFLLRQGQLSVRDGAWLLRVERQAHDIVLDRFPWSARIVKLPWMAAIMQVEW